MSNVILRATPEIETYVEWNTETHSPTEIWRSRDEALRAGVAEIRLSYADVYGSSNPIWGYGWDNLVIPARRPMGTIGYLTRNQVWRYSQALRDNAVEYAEGLMISETYAEQLALAEPTDADWLQSADAMLGWNRLPASPESVILAEQAVLGAIIQQPSLLAQVNWLSPLDFREVAHRALFAGMQAAASTESLEGGLSYEQAVLQDAMAFLMDHTEVRETLIGRTAFIPSEIFRLTPEYMDELRNSSDHPENAAAYGRIVMDARIRRDIAVHTRRLGLHAWAVEEYMSEETVDELLDHTAKVHSAVAALAQRWEEPLLGPANREPIALAATDSPGDTVFVETGLTFAVLGRTDELAELIKWLRPDDLRTRQGRAMYEAAIAVHERGEPLDLITFTAEAERRRLISPSAPVSLDPDDLVAFHFPEHAPSMSLGMIKTRAESMGDSFPVLEFGKRLLIRAISDRTYQVSTGLAIAARDDAHKTPDLASATLRATARIAADRARLESARTVAPPMPADHLQGESGPASFQRRGYTTPRRPEPPPGGPIPRPGP